ncbi:MAG: UvrD-helicase domain-containing protein, partial [Alphaproteobacteria bacterium]
MVAPGIGGRLPVSTDRVTQEQIHATDPAASAWVAANAGSGKTFVLVRRVVRLLLAGVDPAQILCLT